MYIQNLMKFCPFVLKILRGNKILTSIKSHNSGINLQKLTSNNPNLALVNTLHIQSLVKLYPFVLKLIIEWKRNLTSFKGHNSVSNLRKMTSNNPNLDLVNINAHTKFGRILRLSISSQDIERK